jgi:hypothetical protein
MSTYTLSVSEELTLRIRKPKHNTNGSILLLSSQGEVWECVECRESDTERYTEKNWMDKLADLYGQFQSKSDMKFMQERNKKGTQYSRSDHVKTADQCRLSRDPTVDERIITHLVWSPEEETIELQLSETTEPAKGVMGCIKYTNLLLRFASVSVPRPAKRLCV